MPPGQPETPPPDPRHAERRTLEFTSGWSDTRACLNHFLTHRSRWIAKRYIRAGKRIDFALALGLIACVMSLFFRTFSGSLSAVGVAILTLGLVSLTVGVIARIKLSSRRQAITFALTSSDHPRLPQLTSVGRCRLIIDEDAVRLIEPQRTLTLAPLAGLQLERHAQTITVTRGRRALLILPIEPIIERVHHLPVLLDLVQRPGSVEGAIIEYLNAFDYPCPKCKYNLRGNTIGACPECGRAVTPWDLPVRRAPLLPDPS